MSKRHLQAMTSLLISFYLMGCTPLVPPIEVQGNTNTPTLVVPTETETASPTPTETAIPEVKFKENPNIENFRDVVIDCEKDLFKTDNFKKWLESLPPTKFDANLINDVMFVYRDNGSTFYDPRNAPNFTDPNSAPFNRERTFAYCTYMDNNYIVMPIEYYDRNNPDKNQWVITVRNITGMTDTQIQEEIDIWKNKMNVTPWVDSDTNRYSDTSDPLIALTLKQHPDLKNLIDQFADVTSTRNDGKGNRAALDKPGIVLLNFFSINSGHWYE